MSWRANCDRSALFAGLSFAAVQGMVKAYSRADRVKVHPSLAAARWLGAAIALGAQSRVQGVTVEALNLSGCGNMSERLLLHIFSTIKTVRWVLCASTSTRVD